MRHPFERLVSAYENKVRVEIHTFFYPEMQAVHSTSSIQFFFLTEIAIFDILIDKQMLEKVFCSNFAPSLSSGYHLFYKAEYNGATLA